MPDNHETVRVWIEEIGVHGRRYVQLFYNDQRGYFKRGSNVSYDPQREEADRQNITAIVDKSVSREDLIRRLVMYVGLRRGSIISGETRDRPFHYTEDIPPERSDE